MKMTLFCHKAPFALLLTSIAIAVLISNAHENVSEQGAGRPKPTPEARSPSGANASSTTRRKTAPNIQMVLVPAGTFTMGSPDGVGRADEHPQHRVTLQSFYVGKYEVTQSQYRAVMGTNPSYFKGDNFPVEQVSWNDANEFCRRLSRITGLHYRLPSEAEWEYACRAGTTGDYSGSLDLIAWYGKNSSNRTHPVGTRQPNAWGLHDMHGNVWEWVEDWYGDYPPGGDVSNPTGPRSGSQRVFRGGGWNPTRNGDQLEAAFRDSGSPSGSYRDLGFRIASDLP